jgi:hypothetical protein
VNDPGTVPDDDIEPEPPPTEWIPVGRWPAEMQAIIADLRRLEDVIARLDGGGLPGDRNYLVARDFLTMSQQGARSDLAARVLEIHGLASMMETAEKEEPAS